MAHRKERRRGEERGGRPEGGGYRPRMRKRGKRKGKIREGEKQEEGRTRV